jgi:hypothetical protein
VSDGEEDGWGGPAWISIASPEGGGTSMRIIRRGGRWVVDGVYVHGPEITASALKAIPVGRLDLVTNLMTKGTLYIYERETVMKLGDNAYPFYPLRDGVVEEPSLAMLREQARGAPRELRIPGPASDRGRLTRPDRSDPDKFYDRVAEAYREYAAQSRSPATKMAEEANVPVTTVHRWIREARRRGYLPAGRAGKAG